MEIERKQHRVIIHAQLLGNYNLTTYSVGICEEGDSCELIRRFHFDYVHTTKGKKQKVPISHLQYGGKSGGDGFSGKSFTTNKIHNWLSEPRLNFPPMNLMLLLDMVFCEFYTDTTEKIVEDPDWRSHVRKNEIFMLKEYYSYISKHIDSANHIQNKLVRDLYYS